MAVWINVAYVAQYGEPPPNEYGAQLSQDSRQEERYPRQSMIAQDDRPAYGERAEAKEAWRETTQVMWRRRGARSQETAKETADHDF